MISPREFLTAFLGKYTANMASMILWSVLGVVLSILCLIKLPIFAAFDKIGNGYGSKLACGAVFGAGRTLESVLDAELTFPPAKYGRSFDVDNEKRCITVQGKWPFASPAATSCYHSHRLGCFLLPRNGEDYELPDAPVEDLDELLSKTNPKLNFEWPLGNSEHSKRTVSSKTKVNLPALQKIADEHFGNTELHARALLLTIDGEVVFEKYGDDCDANTRLLGWSATKSLLNALLGARIHDTEQISLDTSIATLLPEWNDMPHLTSLTIRQALRMQDGLDVDESYFPGSSITEMLFINGTVDGIIEKAKGGRRPRGENCFHYSSATTNILCKALAASFSSIADNLAHVVSLFNAISTSSFRLEHDVSGNCVGSSFGYATARDWARLGLLYMYDGMWWEQGESHADPAKRTKRIFPEGWVDFTKSPTKTSRGQYGAHFWLGGNNTAAGDDAVLAKHREKDCDVIFPTRLEPRRDWMYNIPQNTFFMHGFEEQMIAINQGDEGTSQSSFVLVRLGATKEKVVNWNKDKFYSDVFGTIN